MWLDNGWLVVMIALLFYYTSQMSLLLEGNKMNFRAKDTDTCVLYTLNGS